MKKLRMSLIFALVFAIVGYAIGVAITYLTSSMTMPIEEALTSEMGFILMVIGFIGGIILGL